MLNTSPPKKIKKTCTSNQVLTINHNEVHLQKHYNINFHLFAKFLVLKNYYTKLILNFPSIYEWCHEHGIRIERLTVIYMSFLYLIYSHVTQESFIIYVGFAKNVEKGVRIDIAFDHYKIRSDVTLRCHTKI